MERAGRRSTDRATATAPRPAAAGAIITASPPSESHRWRIHSTGPPVTPASACPFRPQRRIHLAPAGSAGRHAHAAPGRQRGRCGHRRRGGAHTDRAGQQRPGFRRVLSVVGRQDPARFERLGPCARGLDPRVLQAQVRHGCQDATDARLGQRHRARGRGRLGQHERAFWQAAVRRSAGARDRHRRARLCRAGGRAAEVGCGRAAVARPAGLPRSLHAARARAACRRVVSFARGRARAAPDCAEQRRGVLRR